MIKLELVSIVEVTEKVPLEYRIVESYPDNVSSFMLLG